MAGTPSKVPKGAPPTRFPARVYVGDGYQVIAQKGDMGGGGTPSVPTVEDPHPPVFPMGGGTPLGRTGGGHQSRRGVWVCPALFSRGGWVFTHSMRKNKTHAPSQGNGTIINQSAIVFIREQGLNVTHALNQAQGNPDIDGIPP